MVGALAHKDAAALRDALSAGALRTRDGELVSIPPVVRDRLLRTLDVMESSPDATILPSDDLLTTGQVAELLGVSRTTVVRLVDKGELAGAGSAVHRRIAAAEVRRYQERRARARSRAVDVLGGELDEGLPADEVTVSTR